MKIFIAGYYGFRNLGDELILRSIVSDIKRRFPNADICIWTGDISFTREFQGVKGVSRFSVEDTVDAIKVSDVVIIGGGGLIHEYFSFNFKDIFSSFGFNVAAYFIPAIIAKAFQKPLFYWCHGVGPVFSGDGRKLTKWFYDLADYISVRDEYSFLLLQELGIGKNVLLDGDPVFNLSFPSKESLKRRSLIGINLRTWFGFERGIRAFKDALLEFVEKHELKVLPIPFDLSLDRRAIETFFRSFPSSFVCWDEYEHLETFEDVLNALRSVKIFVGMRLHSLIVSTKVGTPSISIVYDEKVRSFCEKFSVPMIEWGEKQICLEGLVDRAKKEKPIKFPKCKTPDEFVKFIKGNEIGKGVVLSRAEERFINALKLELKEKEEEIRNLKEELRCRETEVGMLKKEIHEIESKYKDICEAYERDRKILEERLGEIYESNWWKVAQKYYRFKETFLRFLEKIGF